MLYQWTFQPGHARFLLYYSIMLSLNGQIGSLAKPFADSLKACVAHDLA